MIELGEIKIGSYLLTDGQIDRVLSIKSSSIEGVGNLSLRSGAYISTRMALVIPLGTAIFKKIHFDKIITGTLKSKKDGTLKTLVGYFGNYHCVHVIDNEIYDTGIFDESETYISGVNTIHQLQSKLFNLTGSDIIVDI